LPFAHRALFFILPFRPWILDFLFAMDAFRKQLDTLMGANRNGDVEIVKRKYYDRDVCRLYIAGLCPHDLFQLTVCRRTTNSNNISYLLFATTSFLFP
jgi:hypothetical protein